MAATVEILSYHGASPDAGTDVAGGSVAFKNADNDTVDGLNPIPIPSGADNFSFLKQFRFSDSVAPDNLIDNLNFYMDGANGMGTGVDLNAVTAAGYTDVIALGAADVTGTADAFSYTSGAPLAITGSQSNPTTGAFGSYLKLQMVVANTAGVGNITTENATFEFDES
jgi:hypothetical protein